MIVCYTGETPPESFTSSIFLAGPSPRKDGDPNWRTEAIETLDRLGYDGVCFAPVYRDKPTQPFDYDNQVEWERKWLNASDLIVFWVPRDLKKLPGFTTNVEFGMWLRSGKVLLGSPEGAEKMTYLDWWSEREGVENFDDLTRILARSVKKLGAGSLRSGGERDIPLHLWGKPEFQSWLKAQKGVGNRVDGAEVVWNFRVGPTKQRTVLFAIHLNVWVESESRSKTNEVVIFRPDVSAVVAFCRQGDNLMDMEVVTVREFRSPANNVNAMVSELPGGSSAKPGVPPEVSAFEEMQEETGLSLSADRMKVVGTRQVAATLSAHRAHVFSVELTPAEMLSLKWEVGKPHGNSEDSEMTFVEVDTVGGLLEKRTTDWSNMGMILQAVLDVVLDV